MNDPSQGIPRINTLGSRRDVHPYLCNIKYSNSLSLISAASTDGWVFSGLSYAKVDSEIFRSYLNGLMEYILRRNKWAPSKVLLILDNAPIHHSNKTKEALMAAGVSVIYLPQYWPELAPIESVFNSFKRKLSKYEDSRIIDLKSEIARRRIVQTMASIDSAEVKRHWANVFKEMRSISAKMKEGIVTE